MSIALSGPQYATSPAAVKNTMAATNHPISFKISFNVPPCQRSRNCKAFQTLCKLCTSHTLRNCHSTLFGPLPYCHSFSCQTRLLYQKFQIMLTLCKLVDVDTRKFAKERIFNLLLHYAPISTRKSTANHPREVQVQIEVVAQVFELVKNSAPCIIVSHASISRLHLSIAICNNQTRLYSNVLDMAKKASRVTFSKCTVFQVLIIDLWPLISYLPCYASTHHSYAVSLMTNDPLLDIQQV